MSASYSYRPCPTWNDLKVCKHFIENGLLKDPRSNNGCTPLHGAAGEGHIEVCKFLLEIGAEKNPRDNRGWTPLHWAAKNGHAEVCKLIADEVDNQNPVADDGKTTPHSLLTDYFANKVFEIKH